MEWDGPSSQTLVDLSNPLLGMPSFRQRPAPQDRPSRPVGGKPLLGGKSDECLGQLLGRCPVPAELMKTADR